MYNFHRIIESQKGLGWKGPQRSSLPNLLAVGRVATHQISLLRAPSNMALNTVSFAGLKVLFCPTFLSCCSRIFLCSILQGFLVIKNLSGVYPGAQCDHMLCDGVRSSAPLHSRKSVNGMMPLRIKAQPDGP